MALFRCLRNSSLRSLPLRSRPVSNPDVADEVPTEFYVVKDYKRNPFYMAEIHAPLKKGYKKQTNPFKKAAERQESVWQPRYYGQIRDISMGWFQIAYLIILPLQLIWFYMFEIRWYSNKANPLGHSLARPSEL